MQQLWPTVPLTNQNASKLQRTDHEQNAYRRNSYLQHQLIQDKTRQEVYREYCIQRLDCYRHVYLDSHCSLVNAFLRFVLCNKASWYVRVTAT